MCFVLLACMLFTGIISMVGCGSATDTDTESSDNIKIVATTFPIYDWITNIIGDESGYEVTMLESGGVDLHNYQPSAKDIATIKESDLFVYIGGESDEWAESLVVEDSNINALNLLEELGDDAKEEVALEGMEGSEEGSEEESEETEYDEHIWLSLKNAITCVSAICDVLTDITPNDALIENANNYMNQLEDLDNDASDSISDSLVMVVGDRFPFLYLTEDYGIKAYAAFSGCSAETEASFETITYLAKQVSDNSLSRIYILEGSDGKIAESIKEASGCDVEIVTLNSMQNITDEDVKNGASYLEIMKENIETLKSDTM